jgi:hypothetical protein
VFLDAIIYIGVYKEPQIEMYCGGEQSTYREQDVEQE